MHALGEALAGVYQLLRECLLVWPDLLQEGIRVLLKLKPGSSSSSGSSSGRGRDSSSNNTVMLHPTCL
jgi:hypothetical protein